jgi:hypothetical protein
MHMWVSGKESARARGEGAKGDREENPHARWKLRDAEIPWRLLAIKPFKSAYLYFLQ